MYKGLNTMLLVGDDTTHRCRHQ